MRAGAYGRVVYDGLEMDVAVAKYYQRDTWTLEAQVGIRTRDTALRLAITAWRWINTDGDQDSESTRRVRIPTSLPRLKRVLPR